MKTFACIAAALCALAPLCADDADEALFVRRIVEFHRDGDTPLVKAQAAEFLALYPNSPFRNKITVIIADTHFNEGKYAAARAAYESIDSEEDRAEVRERYIETLFRLGDYPAVADTIGNDEPLPSLRLLRSEALRLLSTHDQALLSEAQASYTTLVGTEYSALAWQALAEIHHLQGEKKQAAACYRELANEHPEQRSDYLTRAASLQGNEEPEATIALLEGITGTEATYLRGRSFFLLGQHQQALDELAPLSDDGDKGVLYMLIISAHHVEAEEQLERWAAQFTSSYPGDAAIPQIAYLRALGHKRAGRLEQARLYFEEALQSDMPFDHADKAHYEAALILHEQGEHAASHTHFSQIVKNYPGSPLAPTALKGACSKTMLLLAAEDSASLRQRLVSELVDVLGEKSPLDNTERAHYTLILAKAYFDTQEYASAQSLLEGLAQSAPHSPEADRVHLMLALCAQKQGAIDTFIREAEQSLALNPEMAEASRLRLNLFDAYLKRGDEQARAAALLEEVIDSGDEPVKAENILWLANYLLREGGAPLKEMVADPAEGRPLAALSERCARLFEMGLQVDRNAPAVARKDDTALEHEYYKLSHLYGWLGNLGAQEALLKSIIEWQEDNPTAMWKLRARAQLSLAYALYQQGLLNQSLRLFRALAEQKNTDPYTSKASRLFAARIVYALVPEEERTIEDSAVTSTLKALKDLQIRKSLPHEPLHLEAALDYATIRSSLEAPGKQADSRRHLLRRAKESFTCSDDLCSKEYHAARQRQPDKDRLYQAYLMLMDAEIAATEAEMAAVRGDAEEYSLRRDVAKAMYSNLLKDKFAVSKYLVDRAVSGLNALASWEAYANSPKP